MGSLIRVVPASRERPRLTSARAATALSLPCHPNSARLLAFPRAAATSGVRSATTHTLQKSFARSFPDRATHAEPLPCRCRRRRFDQRAPGFRKRPHSSAVCSKRMRRKSSVRKVSLGIAQLSQHQPDRRKLDAHENVTVQVWKSLANRRQRFSQANVRSTTQRLGMTLKPLTLSDRLTISTASCGSCFANALRNCGP